MNRLVLIILSAFCASEIFAQSATKNNEPPTTQPQIAQISEVKAVTLADAQKAYVAGNWKLAVEAYEQVCPSLDETAKTECYLWNILALSQTGVAKDFSKAGKRLDSLIQKTNPQHPVYADLIMTKAQFQMYLDKYDNAAESLVHAIESSNENQKPVLQKICVAMQAKVKKENLNEACENLKKTGVPSAAVQNAPAPTATSSTTDISVTNTETPKVSSSAPNAIPESSAQAAKASTAASSATQAKPYWFLQLGAFGLKSNADILVNNLKKRGIASSIEERQGETKTLFVVQTGNFETKEQAVDFGAQKLTPLNIEFRAMQKK